MAAVGVDFTPAEIKRQAGRLREQAEAWNKSSNTMIRCLGDIHQTINGGQATMTLDDPNSGIVTSILAVKGTYEHYCTTAKQKFDKLADIMEKWAASSTSNEEKASTNVDELAKKVDAIYEMLESLKKA